MNEFPDFKPLERTEIYDLLSSLHADIELLLVQPVDAPYLQNENFLIALHHCGFRIELALGWK